MNADIKRRIVVTLACLTALYIIYMIPLPFVEGIPQNTPREGLANVMVGALGLMPFISAYLLIMLFTPIIPALRKYWNTYEENPIRFHYTLMFLTLLIACVHSFILSRQIVNSGYLESGVPMIIVHIILVTSVFATLGFAQIINRWGVGQGLSLVLCIHITITIATSFKRYFFDDLSGALVLLIILVLVISAFVCIISAKRTFNVNHSIVSVPYAITGLLPGVFIPIICGIIVFVLFNFFSFDLSFTAPIIFFTTLLVSPVISFLYMLWIMTYQREYGYTLSVSKIAAWAIVWSVIFVCIFFGSYFARAFLPPKFIPAFFTNLTSLYIFVFIITRFIQRWRCRNWRCVYTHSHTARVYAKATELHLQGKQIQVIPGESYGAAHGFFAGPLAERQIFVNEDINDAETTNPKNSKDG